MKTSVNLTICLWLVMPVKLAGYSKHLKDLQKSEFRKIFKNVAIGSFECLKLLQRCEIFKIFTRVEVKNFQNIDSESNRLNF